MNSVMGSWGSSWNLVKVNYMLARPCACSCIDSDPLLMQTFNKIKSCNGVRLYAIIAMDAMPMPIQIRFVSSYSGYRSLCNASVPGSSGPRQDSIPWHRWERALIGHGYTVRKLLGAGGFGRAYKCEDSSGAEKVVKVSWHPATRASLQEEYNFMRKLRHHNLPHVYQGSENTTISKMLPPSQKHI